MAEMVEREALPSSSENPSDVERKEDPAEPEAKRRKLYKNDETHSDKLEHRLGGILCCAVCLDLPRAAVYQCSNGHLMCAGCFTHVLADARLRDESATCPNCRIEISKTSASRNLAVEKAISELPSECQFCSKEFPRHSLDHHEDSQCDDRVYQIIVNSRNPRSITFLAGLVYLAMFVYWILTAIFRNESIFNSTLSGPMNTDIRITGCKFSCIGCPWKGPFHERVEHESACVHPLKSGSEVMEALEVKEKVRLEEAILYNHVFELLSFEKIMFNDLQLKPYRTDEFVNKLYYETSRFTAFSHQWVVKANINNSQRDPTQSTDREISYQLILRNKSAVPMSIQYIALKGPFGDARIAPQVHAYTFCCEKDDSSAQMEAIPAKLPLPDARETNRLLANKAINFRLIMFLASK